MNNIVDRAGALLRKTTGAVTPYQSVRLREMIRDLIRELAGMQFAWLELRDEYANWTPFEENRDHILRAIDSFESADVAAIRREAERRDAKNPDKMSERELRSEVKRLVRGVDNLKIRSYELGQKELHDSALNILRGE